ncbi:MAG: response regulator transcription factor, partial [Deltaproteobacteria bacterium]|nr:response regulator transcription factor [Deltaproteobacteria bacterium]
MKPLRVLLADDHSLVRAGIRSLIEKIPLIEVVGEASDGRHAFELIKKREPNVVLMDIAMAGLNGLEVAERVIKNFPTVKVIILSMHTNEEYISRALQIGVSGYLVKDSAAAELEIALTAVSSGRTYLAPSISRQVVEGYLQKTSAKSAHFHTLTPRQREILQLIAEGKNTKEIAYMLDVSIKTVETHRAQLMDRLNIHDVPGLVRYALRKGLTTL